MTHLALPASALHRWLQGGKEGQCSGQWSQRVRGGGDVKGGSQLSYRSAYNMDAAAAASPPASLLLPATPPQTASCCCPPPCYCLPGSVMRAGGRSCWPSLPGTSRHRSSGMWMRVTAAAAAAIATAAAPAAATLMSSSCASSKHGSFSPRWGSGRGGGPPGGGRPFSQVGSRWLLQSEVRSFSPRRGYRCFQSGGGMEDWSFSSHVA